LTRGSRHPQPRRARPSLLSQVVEELRRLVGPLLNGLVPGERLCTLRNTSSGQHARPRGGSVLMLAIGIPWLRWANPAIECTLQRASNSALKVGVAVLAMVVTVLATGGVCAFITIPP